MTKISAAAEPRSEREAIRTDKNSDARIELRGVGFRYQSGLLAIKDIDLIVHGNRNIAIVGPSGCGKSTLLRVLAGLQKPTTGAIVRGAVPPGVHPLSMMFQEDTLLPWSTVYNNAKLHFRFRRQPKEEVRQTINDLLPLVGLESFADAYPYQLSIGMRRRIAFISAIAPGPSVLLLDEPFSALDEPTRIALHQDVLAVTRDRDVSMVLVTHDIAEAISLSDEVIVLSNRPGTIAARHAVPFGNDRDLLDLRQSQDFLDLYGALWRDLTLQIKTKG
jgi:NitT/TauT family transport system ATP-binding protein